MRRGRDEPEALPGQGPAGPRGDPEEAIEDYSPFETFPLVLLYKLFVESEWSVRDLRRFCSADRKLASLCKRPNIWRRLYFLKVVRDPHLIEIQHRYPESDDYIQNVLVNTDAGREWASYPEAQTDPFVLLIAFAYARARPERPRLDTMIWWRHPEHAEFRTHTYLNWSEIGVYSAVYFRRGSHADQLLARLRPLDVTPERDDGKEVKRALENTAVILFFLEALQSGYVPSLRTRVEHAGKSNAEAPRSLTERCIACGVAILDAEPRACGNLCGRAVYCGDECARTHWYAGHHAECK